MIVLRYAFYVFICLACIILAVVSALILIGLVPHIEAEPKFALWFFLVGVMFLVMASIGTFFLAMLICCIVQKKHLEMWPFSKEKKTARVVSLSPVTEDAPASASIA